MESKFKKIKILYTALNFDAAGSGKILNVLAKGLNNANFQAVIGK